MHHLNNCCAFQVQFIISDGTTKLEGASVTVGAGYELDTWRHICFVRDRGGIPTTNPCTTSNVVYTGTVINTTTEVSSANVCQGYCQAESACVGFSWSPASTYTCTQLSSLGVQSTEIGAVSGPAQCNATVVGYVDGVRTTSVVDPTADNVTNSDPLYMGKATWAGEQNLIGRLDEVLIYNTALTATQVTAVYEACLPASTAALECPQCPLDIKEPWPLMENFQAGGQGPLECRDCCKNICDEMCFAGGTNPARCVGATPREAYLRCIGEGYIRTSCDLGEQYVTTKSPSNDTWVDAVILSSNASTVETNIGSGVFNSLFSTCPIVRYTRNEEAVAFYVRKSQIPTTFDAYSVFTDTFVSTDNIVRVDFELYDSLYDAQAEINQWAYCNYDVAGVGFPRDCGKSEFVQERWLSMPGGFATPGVTSGLTLSIYSGSDCPLTRDQGVHNAGCYFGGTARRCLNDCVLPGVSEAQNGKCDTWTGKCTFPADCAAGYVPVGASCVDIDECQVGGYGATLGASRNAYCTNSIGSYSLTCLSGYEGNATLGVCADIDECSVATANAGSSSNSTTTIDGYCTAESVCVNTVGSFTCNCPDGYTGDGLVGGTGCTDVNECQLGLHTCANAALCTNYAGNYSCSCRSGFTGNGYDGLVVSRGTNCTDIDECTATDANAHTCDPNAECDNEVGHFDCACNSGFLGGGYLPDDPCIDIDECALGANCTANSQCVNLPGNYSCMCDAGFSGDGLVGCTRCTIEGTGKSVSFDGYDDKTTLSVTGTSSLQLSGSSGLTAQVWFTRDGASSFTTRFDFDRSYNFTETGDSVTNDQAGSMTFDPIMTYHYNDTSVAQAAGSSSAELHSSGLALFIGLEGSTLVAGITMNITCCSSTNSSTVSESSMNHTIHRVVMRSPGTVVDTRWHRATIRYSTSTSELTLMLDTITGVTPAHADSSSSLLEDDPTLMLAADALSSGAFKGKIRDARFWSSALDTYALSNTDCTSGSPLVWFKWEAVADTGNGCPLGDYCRIWLAPATCQGATHTQCGTTTQASTGASQGTLADAIWTLSGALS